MREGTNNHLTGAENFKTPKKERVFLRLDEEDGDPEQIDPSKEPISDPVSEEGEKLKTEEANKALALKQVRAKIANLKNPNGAVSDEKEPFGEVYDPAKDPNVH